MSAITGDFVVCFVYVKEGIHPRPRRQRRKALLHRQILIAIKKKQKQKKKQIFMSVFDTTIFFLGASD